MITTHRDIYSDWYSDVSSIISPGIPIWHVVWHSIWQSIWAFYLTYYSEILSGIFSGISSGSLSDVVFYLAYILTFFLWLTANGIPSHSLSRHSGSCGPIWLQNSSPTWCHLGMIPTSIRTNNYMHLRWSGSVRSFFLNSAHSIGTYPFFFLKLWAFELSESPRQFIHNPWIGSMVLFFYGNIWLIWSHLPSIYPVFFSIYTIHGSYG